MWPLWLPVTRTAGTVCYLRGPPMPLDHDAAQRLLRRSQGSGPLVDLGRGVLFGLQSSAFSLILV